MNIKETIRAEIERQMKYYEKKEMNAWDSQQDDEDALWYQGHRKMCSKLLSFLDSLPEQPVEGLEEEIKRYYSENFAYITSNQPTLSILSNIARHFAEWGAEHLRDTTKMIDEGLEDALEGGLTK